MMGTTKSGLALLLFFMVAACSERAPVETNGAELLKPFKSQLQQALKAGMTEGPVSAISVCADKAPQIAASLSVDGVQMGRTSHRLRNPANTAPAWATEILEDYVNGARQWEPVVVNVGGGRAGRAEPIVAQPLCIVCHGDNIAAELAEKIGSAYPDDRATGFQAGDLRGIFWVEYPEER